MSKRISQKKEEKSRWEALLAINDGYSELQEAARLLALVNAEIEVLEECWLELHDEAEKCKCQRNAP